MQQYSSCLPISNSGNMRFQTPSPQLILMHTYRPWGYSTGSFCQGQPDNCPWECTYDGLCSDKTLHVSKAYSHGDTFQIWQEPWWLFLSKIRTNYCDSQDQDIASTIHKILHLPTQPKAIQLSKCQTKPNKIRAI